MSRQIIALLSLFAAFSQKGIAQQKDSMQTLKQFIEVCTSYKQQIPLHLSIDYISSANVVTGNEDSSSMAAEFYLLEHGAYMKFGEMEEIVNDSAALLVSSKLKRMILYSNAKPIVNQLKAAMGIQVPKSSINEWGKRFQVYKKSNGDQETIELQDRNTVYKTALAKETIEMLYNVLTKIPVEVVNIKRSLLEVSKAEYENYQKDSLMTGKLVETDGSYYLVKEQKMMFKYKQVESTPLLALPVSIADRVTETIQSSIRKNVPAKGFEGYVLTEE